MTFLPGDISGLQSLTDDDHLYPDHINEFRQSMLAAVVVGKTPNCQYYCDGEDDDVQLQAAIDAAELVGGIVFIKAGTYNLSTGLVTNNKGISIIGEGKCDIRSGEVGESDLGVVLNYTGAGSALKIDKDESQRFYDFKNFTIVGSSSGAKGLDLNYAPRSQFENILVTGFSNGYGIYMKNMWGSKFINCQAEYNNIGWFIDSNCHHANFFSCDALHNAYGVQNDPGNSSFDSCLWLGGTVSHNTEKGFNFNLCNSWIIDGVYSELSEVENADYLYYLDNCKYYSLRNPTILIAGSPSNTDVIHFQACSHGLTLFPVLKTTLGAGKYDIVFNNTSTNNTVIYTKDLAISDIKINLGTSLTNNIIPLYNGRFGSNTFEASNSIILDKITSINHSVATDKATLYLIQTGGKYQIKVRWPSGSAEIIKAES
jgi:hypothetical protein